MSLSYRIKRARVRRYTPVEAALLATAICLTVIMASMVLMFACYAPSVTVLTYDAYVRAS